MANVLGKESVVTLDGDALTTYINKLEIEREVDEVDVTCFGSAAKTFKGALKGGSVSLEGIYDDGATGPAEIIKPLLGTNVTLVHQAEGAGTGKPETSVTVHVKNYKETSAVADVIKWSAELTLAGAVSDNTQS